MTIKGKYVPVIGWRLQKKGAGSLSAAAAAAAQVIKWCFSFPGKTSRLESIEDDWKGSLNLTEAILYSPRPCRKENTPYL